MFRRFQEAAAANDAAGTLQALRRWLDATGLGGESATLAEFVRAAGDPALAVQIDLLERHLYARSPEDRSRAWTGRSRYRAVKRVRRRQLRKYQAHRSERAIRDDKRGFIPFHQPKIWQRLGIDGEAFIDHADRLLKQFGSAVEAPGSLVNLCARRQTRYLRGMRAARRVFVARQAA